MTLETLITQYITFRKSLGLGFQKPTQILRAFCRALGPEIAVAEIDPGQVKAFLDGAGPITSNWHQKHSTLRMFFDYGVKHGLITSAPLPARIPKRPSTHVPHIYTQDELRRLLEATTTFRKRYQKLHPETLRTLLLLLYGAGLRVSEALALNLADVDLEAGLLTIRETKFHKTRLLPIGADLNRALTNYAVKRSQDTKPQDADSPFFIGEDRSRLSYDTVNQAFRKLRAKAGVIRTDGARYQPRIHDLRHSFAVDRLTTWYRAGADVRRLLPKLSTYLGHAHLSDTQVYLTMTPELLEAASERFAQYALREVNDD
jgi:site-specific recombinase XerD